MKAERIRGAGAVVWRRASAQAISTGPGSDIEVLLVYRKKKNDWSFPKGQLKKKEKREHDEHPLLTAVREVRQEAKVDIRIGRRLPTVKYPIRSDERRMLFWAAELLVQRQFKRNEVDRLEWLTAPDARKRVSYGADHELLDALLARDLPTTPVIFVRNAHDARGDFADDDSRALSKKGTAEAKALAGLLGCFGTLPVLSSSAFRCMQTVGPYASKRGGQVGVHTELSRRKFDAEAAEALIRNQIRAGTGVIVCSHQEELSQLASRVFGSGDDLFEDPAAPTEHLNHAEFVVFHLNNQEQVIARERFAPTWKHPHLS